MFEYLFLCMTNGDDTWKADRKPPGVGRGRGRGDIAGTKPAKGGIGRGSQDDGKGGSGRGRGGGLGKGGPKGDTYKFCILIFVLESVLGSR
jgi:hypothetical protein